jgi:hypothetical protein
MLKPEATGVRVILVPFDRREAMSIAEACRIAGKSESTMRSWCVRHGLGRRVGDGPWVVSRVALAMFLDGDYEALARYHRGERAGASLQPYFARLYGSIGGA